MAPDLHGNRWLADLVEEELASHEPAHAPRRAPAELPEGPPASLDARARTHAARSIRDLGGATPARASEAFLARFRGHVDLLLDVAGLAGATFDRARRRAELAALLAALAGEIAPALAADPGGPRGHRPPAVRRALVAAALTFSESGWPPGDPRTGLPLAIAVVRIERLLLARLAAAYYRSGRLDEAEARRRLEQAGRDLALLVEALAGQAAAAGRLDAQRRKAVRHQVARLRLSRELERRVKEALREPRGPGELARAAPRRLRSFLVEQLLVAEALADAMPAPARAFTERLANEAGIPPDRLPALRAEAAALAARAQRWQEGPPEWVPGEVQGLPEEWGDAADELVDKVTDIFQDNLEAIATEVRRTGELGQLLGKAATGTALSSEEKRKVKAQLIDLAKVVPALAIFAAPGGMLLLPLLAKLLPFNVLPSPWERRPTSTPPPRKPGTGS